MVRGVLAVIVITAFVMMTSFAAFREIPSPDLYATWLAGHFWAEGAFDQIYPTATETFIMQPPDDWTGYLASRGYEGPVYPFIYPPIWAWLASFVTPYVPFEVISNSADWINPMLLSGIVLLAWRISGTEVSLTVFFLVAMMIAMFTFIGSIALMQNQPQILVAFLLLLAIERTKSGAPIVGGAVLGVAAAMKLYPLFFIAIWLVQREYRAVVAFLVFGGVLGVLSLAVGGWPLHAEFLSHISTISNSVLFTPINYNLDTSISQLFFADQMQQIEEAYLGTRDNPDIPVGWTVMSKPVWWQVLSKALLVAALTLVLFIGYRYPGDPLIWPVAMIAFSMVGPLSWSYHYLSAVVFAPALLSRYGWGLGAAILAAIFVPMSLFLRATTRSFEIVETTDQLISTLALIVLAVAFWAALSRPERWKSA